MENSQTNYFLGVVVAITPEDDDRLKNAKEYHEVLCDIPGVIQGVHCFPKSGEIDEPRIGDQVLLLDLDPEYHSYMIYEKLKEDDFIGFRSSGNVLNITPEGLTFGTYNIKDAGNEKWENKDEPQALNASIKLIKKEDDNDELEIKVAGNTRIDVFGDSGITVNGGSNGGMVNVGFLKQLIQAISTDLQVAGSGASLSALLGMIDQLEDKNFKH